MPIVEEPDVMPDPHQYGITCSDKVPRFATKVRSKSVLPRDQCGVHRATSGGDGELSRLVEQRGQCGSDQLPGVAPSVRIFQISAVQDSWNSAPSILAVDGIFLAEGRIVHLHGARDDRRGRIVQWVPALAAHAAAGAPAVDQRQDDGPIDVLAVLLATRAATEHWAFGDEAPQRGSVELQVVGQNVVKLVPNSSQVHGRTIRVPHAHGEIITLQQRRSHHDAVPEKALVGGLLPQVAGVRADRIAAREPIQVELDQLPQLALHRFVDGIVRKNHERLSSQRRSVRLLPAPIVNVRLACRNVPLGLEV
mmetsp:Transcript_77968/g.252930  ORF Transcript_77968/g.252930 Transcript_77968/m.252930 type:complete len:308 (+) Transcript_77968:762-1685(+)